MIRNLQSVQNHPEVVDAYLGKEVSLGWTFRFDTHSIPCLPELTISPIKVIPKSNRPDKWCLIVDPSSRIEVSMMELAAFSALSHMRH